METSIQLGLKHSGDYISDISNFHFHFRYHFCLCIAKQTTIKFILDISLNNFSSHCSLWLSNVITIGSQLKRPSWKEIYIYIWQREGHDMYRFVSATHVLLNSSLDMSVYLINEYIRPRII